MPYSPDPDHERTEQQHAVLVGLLNDWDGVSPGSEVIQARIDAEGEIRNGAVVHFALTAALPTTSGVRRANRICSAWFVHEDRELVDALMKELYDEHLLWSAANPG